MERVIEEQRLRGKSAEDALDDAIREVVPEIDWNDDSCDRNHDDGSIAEWDDDNEKAEASADSFAEAQSHPLQQQATNLLCRFYDVAERSSEGSIGFNPLLRGAGDIVGGLSQALPLPPLYEIDEAQAGLSLVQLKRALRGAAFVHGALFLLRSDNLLEEEELRLFMADTEALSSQIMEVINTLRESQM
jgi:hypothetical protein